MHAPILEPSHATSHYDIRVRFCETDLMGIVHHGNSLTYMEAGRVDWLHKRGVTYAAWAAAGMHLPVVDANLRYRAPAHFDEVLTVETTLLELRNVSLRYGYRIRRGAALLCEGSTRLASVDQAHKLRRFTDEMLSSLTAGEKR